jgi:glycosyltransferase involved in cell wall biosynthesis
MKVSLFVHDLSANSIVRAYPIAKAIQLLGHEVEVLGLTYNTDKVYEPYKNEFEYKTIRSFLDIRWVIINARKLAKMASGDMVYAFKPVWDSFYPALLYSGFGMKRRLILDAEDNELWDAFIGNGWKALRTNKYYPINPVYNKLLHPLTFMVKRKTVVCSQLQKRYGGKIVLHGPMAERFNPGIYSDRETLRNNFSLPTHVPMLLFAGRPLYYNGLSAVVEALMEPNAQNWHLVLAGDAANEAFINSKKILGDRCHLIGFVSNSDMPELLKMVDVVPILQMPIPSTDMQIPAKMLEAMSMKKGIITTPVCDMKKIIGNNRGWIVEYDNKAALAALLYEIEHDPAALENKGNAAREYFLKEASIETIANRINPFLK